MNAATTILRSTAALCSVIVLGLTSCGEDQKAEMEQLTVEVEALRHDLVSEQERLKAVDQERRELRNELSTMKASLREAEGKAKSLERDLERYQKREEAARMARDNEPSRKEMLEAAQAEVAKKSGALVTIKGDASSGQGVLVAADDKIWIYLPAELLRGNAKLEVTREDGSKLESFGSFAVAGDVDLVRLEVQGEIEGALTPAEATEVKTGVTLLGLGGAVPVVTGRCYGGDMTSLKGDAKLMELPAGSPVFHGESGELLGVVLDSLQQNRVLWPRPARGGEVGAICRVDRAIPWTEMPIGTFLEEARALADADRLTRLLQAFASAPPGPESIPLDGAVGSGGVTVRQLLQQNGSVSAVRSLLEFNDWLKEKGGRASPSDIKRRIDGSYGELGRISARNTKTFAARSFSPAHAAAAQQSLEWRREAEKKLADFVASQE